MKLLIEEDENGRAVVTTDDETLEVAKALLLLELAKISLLSAYLGGPDIESEERPQE